MYEFLIKEYINRMTLKDIKIFAQKEGVSITDNENKIIFDYIKNYWRTFLYGNPRPILDELKEKLNENTYNKMELLYIQAKNKIK
jgi:sulfur relay (sulfurtransferase) DsrC/TusE family protein